MGVPSRAGGSGWRKSETGWMVQGKKICESDFGGELCL